MCHIIWLNYCAVYNNCNAKVQMSLKQMPKCLDCPFLFAVI